MGKLGAGREPFFMPTIRAALITRHHWMIVVCRSCGTVIDLDLRVKRRSPGSDHPDGAARRALPALQRAWLPGIF